MLPPNWGRKLATADDLIRLSKPKRPGRSCLLRRRHSFCVLTCGCALPAASLCRVGSEHQQQILGGRGGVGGGICETAVGPWRDVTGGSAGAQRLNSALSASLPQGDPESIISRSARPPRTEPIAQFLPAISL